MATQFRLPTGANGDQAASLIYRAHTSPVTALAFARESRLLATGGSHDRQVTVANWDSLERLAVLSGHESWVTLLRWGSGDLCLLSSAEHDSVKLWRRDGVEFSASAERTVSLETLCSALHCRVDSAGSFAVAGIGGDPPAVEGDGSSEHQLDERDLLTAASEGDPDSEAGSIVSVVE